MKKQPEEVAKCRCGNPPDVYFGEYELWYVRCNSVVPFHCFEVWGGNKVRAIRAWNKLMGKES